MNQNRRNVFLKIRVQVHKPIKLEVWSNLMAFLWFLFKWSFFIQAIVKNSTVRFFDKNKMGLSNVLLSEVEIEKGLPCLLSFSKSYIKIL